MGHEEADEQQPSAPKHSSRRPSRTRQDAGLQNGRSAGAAALGVSAEAAAFLTASGAKLLQMSPVTLVFPPGTRYVP